eukprot:Ihof_evm1s1270 gene=Ihof_evmTU1s1270
MCDIQTKFEKSIPAFSNLVAVAKRMVAGGKLLGIPLVATEQYPQGLGSTVEELKDSYVVTLTKNSFSMITPEMNDILATHSKRTSAVLFGLETQVCIQQTALDLLERGYNVFLVADGVASRMPMDRQYAIE